MRRTRSARSDLPARLERRRRAPVTARSRPRRRLAAAADDDDVIDSGAQRLVDDELQRRCVTDRQQLLGDRLRRGEEPCPHPGSRDHGAADLHAPHHIPTQPSWADPPVAFILDAHVRLQVRRQRRDDRGPAVVHRRRPHRGRPPHHRARDAGEEGLHPVGVTFRGGGFYKTDSRGSSSRSSSVERLQGRRRAAARRRVLVVVELDRDVVDVVVASSSSSSGTSSIDQGDVGGDADRR